MSTVQETWRELVDLKRLAAWMDTQGLAAGEPIEHATLLAGGTQNLLLRFMRGGRAFVLRRAPPHPRVDGTQTMRREARVLAALAGSAVPHPRLIAACGDPAVLGAGFNLMQAVEGHTLTTGVPAAVAAQPAWCHRMGLAMAEAIAELSLIDPVAVGLADFGRTENWLQRQAPRWRAHLDSYAEYAGWPGPQSLPGVDEISRWLQAHVPRHFQPGIVHGDYHIGNVLFRRDAPEIAAVLDWELATLGDPLLDLGWLIATWPEAQHSSQASQLDAQPLQGFPTPAELAGAYAARTGRDLTDLRWCTVLAGYKLGIILEGTHARAHAGKAPMAVALELRASGLRLMHSALNTVHSAA